MVVDARSLPEKETIKTDVCIVGAGTAGITLAREFIDQDFCVCLLESGGVKPDPETQSLYRGENVGHPYYSLDTARARYFGGSSNRWDIDIGDNSLGVRLRPLDKIDFEKRDWVPYSGWPFDKSHLDPYYERAQVICQINPATFDVEDWSDPIRSPCLPMANDQVETIIYKFGRRDPFIREYPDQVSQANNITIYLYANVLEIETNDTGQSATRLRVGSLQGNEFWVSARLFILAVGGIETPRLLLLSNKTQNSGLGNQNDLVGRFFMEHPHFWSGVFVPSDPNIFRSTGLYNDIHIVSGVAVIGKLALSEKVLRREKLLNQNIQLMPRLVSDAFMYPPVPSHTIADNLTNAYRKARRKIGKTLSKKRIKVFQFANMAEQVPDPQSRVSLMNERDGLGQAKVQLDWRINDIDICSVRRTQEIIGEALSQAGLGRLYIQLNGTTPPANVHGGYHHMGTTRMDTNPKKGVVDENCQIHDISNLFIAGPSVFPTGGYANPVLTVVALTVRLADHVKTLMRRDN